MAVAAERAHEQRQHEKELTAFPAAKLLATVRRRAEMQENRVSHRVYAETGCQSTGLRLARRVIDLSRTGRFIGWFVAGLFPDCHPVRGEPVRAWCK